MDSKKKKRICGTTETHKNFLKKYKYYGVNARNTEKRIKYYITHNAIHGSRIGIVKIPVVVHVVYNTDEQNISDEQIQSQIDVLNQDFRTLNDTSVVIPDRFEDLIADARIEFELAKRDPECNSTNGITRTHTDTTEFTHGGIDEHDMKSGISGGKDGWSRDKYLNIWICNITNVAGYATRPVDISDPENLGLPSGFPLEFDGVVIDYQFFGTTGTATVSGFTLGRTVTHEIGHWLGLIHIWGDDHDPENGICSDSDEEHNMDSPACSGSDEVDDTPNQACPTIGYHPPSPPRISCENGPDGDMFMNFMDNTNDNVKGMFTPGQVDRMNATLHVARSSILSSDGLIPHDAVSDSDLWSQNTHDDIGNEPDTESERMYVSDDIWMRNIDDGNLNQEHQNPIYRPSGFSPNYVYVRIRNKGCTESGIGNVKLYWAKASSSLSWPQPWDGTVTSPALMGEQIGTENGVNVDGRESKIVKFEWHPPDPEDYSSFGGDKAHFCLLSRIEIPDESNLGMAVVEGSNLNENVRNNNNIVWKNITIVSDEVENGNRSSNGIIKGIGKKAQTKLVISIPKNEKNILNWGSIQLQTDEKLFEKWKKGGSKGFGIKIIKDCVFEIVEPNGKMENILLESTDIHPIKIIFKPKENKEDSSIFIVDLTQHVTENEKDVIVGGLRFVLKNKIRKIKKKGCETTTFFDGCEWVKK